ncbi:hypothetical protein ACHJH3_06820 [Campylobacter sp. MOP7]|uniref:hypothetical protein n=1 Tax=Campylobacter canis TaxID=3378588 RepID=UPI00387E3829
MVDFSPTILEGFLDFFMFLIAPLTIWYQINQIKLYFLYRLFYLKHKLKMATIMLNLINVFLVSLLINIKGQGVIFFVMAINSLIVVFLSKKILYSDCFDDGIEFFEALFDRAYMEHRKPSEVYNDMMNEVNKAGYKTLSKDIDAFAISSILFAFLFAVNCVIAILFSFYHDFFMQSIIPEVFLPIISTCFFIFITSFVFFSKERLEFDVLIKQAFGMICFLLVLVLVLRVATLAAGDINLDGGVEKDIPVIVGGVLYDKSIC